MSKQTELEKVAKEIEQCAVCKEGKIGVAVPGEGNPDARVAFIGEAPGKNEAKTGRPFIGRSGNLLRKMIREILSLDDEKDVYITSPVKYLPERGTPTPAHIAHGRIHLLKQLDIIDPKYIVLMGSVAAQGVLEHPTSPGLAGLRGAGKIQVKKDHGKVIEKDGKKYFITVHPAAGLRFPPLRKTFIEDFEKLKTIL